MSRKAQTAKELEFENDALKKAIKNLKRQLSALQRQMDNNPSVINDIHDLFDEEDVLRLHEFQKSSQPDTEKKPTELEDIVFLLPNGQERRVKRRITA